MYLREYETIYILRPDLSDDESAQINERMGAVLDREGAKILKRSIWGKKKLAYEIKKQPKGVYVHVSYLGKPEVVKEFERNLKIVEPVLKYQTIKIAEFVDVEARVSQQEAADRAAAEAEAKRKAEMPVAVEAAAAVPGEVKPRAAEDDEENTEEEWDRTEKRPEPEDREEEE
jgi:small subunit ribosomal protein S6